MQCTVGKESDLKGQCDAGIINSLEKLVQKSGFPERCKEWRTRGHIEGD